MNYIVKRDGRKVQFNRKKIEKAVEAAFIEVDGELTEYDEEKAVKIADYIQNKVVDDNLELSVEQIQDLVENGLMSTRRKDVARAYIIYRNKRTAARENTIDKIIQEITHHENEEWDEENSNKNALLNTTIRDYVAGAVSKDQFVRYLYPENLVKAHEEGLIHVHDTDYIMQSMYNCCLINLEDMLQNGTVISGTYIDKPTTFSTACTIATQIISQVASSQYGGQSISLAHLSPFINETRKRLKRKYPTLLDDMIEDMVQDDIAKGIQTIQYQVVTLLTTNGQAPFITVYMNINEVEDGPERHDLALAIEEMLKQRIKGVKNEKGVYIAPAFPKLIYALDENNIHEDSEYWYLTKIAAECSAKRMVPDYISNKIMREQKDGDTYTCMGCRSFLTVDRCKENYAKALNYDKYKGHKYYGRFNQGVVSINLPDIACAADGNEEKFWKIFDQRLEMCHQALQLRHKLLRGTSTNVAPILWQYGAIARLGKEDIIDELLFHGYSTISLGYIGVYECTMRMKGCSHTDPKGKEFALKVMQYMNDKCAQWKAEEDIDYSLYGTPAESLTYKFAQATQERYGKIKDVTDHNYFTNSFHVCVREKIDAFTKLKFESEFQALSPGGQISYVEIPPVTTNMDAIVALVRFIYDNIMYAEINTKLDYCQKCGYDGEIKIVTDPITRKYIWKCLNCGNTDKHTMNITRRTCGYLGQNYWNQGRTEEIKERVLHLGEN